MSYDDLSIKTREKGAKVPVSTVVSCGNTERQSIPGEAMGTFTGKVWLDPVLRQDGISFVNVNFTPCSRTHWHRHDGGQLLKVTGGSGWVCDQGQKPRRITVGDVIWCPPGGIHWHGADDKAFMVHEATSYGKIEWYEPVFDGEYGRKNA